MPSKSFSKTIKVTIVVLAFLCAAAFLFRKEIYGFITVTKSNIPVKQFALRNFQGDTIQLHNLKGKVVLVDLWATWCRPCIQSFPALQNVYNRYKDNPSFYMLVVNSAYDDSFEKASDFVSKSKFTFPYGYDDHSAFSNAYAKDGLPTYVLIDKKGNVRNTHLGYSPDFENFEEDLKSKVDAYLSEE